MAAKKKTIQIEAFDEDDELDEDEEEALALAEAEKLKAAEEENDEEDDSDDEEDESEDDDSDEDDEDDPELATDTENKFAPYVYQGEENTSWKLETLFEEVDGGENIYIYDVGNEVFYKLQPIEVGEIGQ